MCDQIHVVGRIWPEVNNQVNYLIKTALLQMVDQEEINMNDSLGKYCVSNLASQLCQVGLTRVVGAWNAYRIPGEITRTKKIITTSIYTFQPHFLYFTGKWVPNVLAANGCPKKITQELLPHSLEALALYNQDIGATLTTYSTFGDDPFSMEQDKLTVESQFADRYTDISNSYSSTVNNNFAPLKRGIAPPHSHNLAPLAKRISKNESTQAINLNNVVSYSPSSTFWTMHGGPQPLLQARLAANTAKTGSSVNSRKIR